ncbi:calcium-binding protein [Aquicoccus sp. SCR17]|nr:calcium-binding protein [Carideicomes alvinocaridis]
MLLIALSLAAPARAERDSVAVFFFGNSLVNYYSEDSDDPDLTAVPYWLARLADAADREFAADGEWGFLRDFARLPPEPVWSFRGVRGVWTDSARPFGTAGFDTIVITPSNFVQGQTPEAAYENNPSEGSPLSATLTLLDGAMAAVEKSGGAQPRYLVYEGWPDMAAIAEFPPSDGAMEAYHDHTLGPYRAWFSSYLSAIDAARPEARVGLIPVASTLARWLQGPLQDLPADALYVDDAPHGTPTLYLLAAAVTYTKLYETAPPADFVPPDTIHPAVREAWPRLIASLQRRAAAAKEAEAASSEEGQQTAGAAESKDRGPVPDFVSEAQAPEPGGLAQPALAMGLNGIADWSSEQPFLDLMKTARPWTGHVRGEDWGGFPAERLEEEGYLDEDGWPLRLPEEVTRLETLVLTDMPEEAASLAGRYVLRWTGEGDLRVGGRADNTRYSYSKREVRFDYTPGDGAVSITFSRTEPDDPIRDITLVREDRQQLFEAGALFNPDWLARVQDLRMVRFMDWMFTNGSLQEHWDQRPRAGDYTYVRRGVPLSVMLRLVNRIGADPWFNMPHLADDDYVRQFAEAVREGLDPALKAHVEYSNELWNFIFPQAQWAAKQAEDRWDTEDDAAWIQFAGLRAAEVADIWRDSFGEGAEDRLVNVIGVHTGWQGLEEAQFDAPLAGDLHPVDSFDAMAVAGYFGYELGTPEMLDSVTGWIEASRLVAGSQADERGLEGKARRDYLQENGMNTAFSLAAAAISGGSLAELTDEILPYHAKVAKRRGLSLLMYEGGTHVTGIEAVVENEEVTDFFTRFNYSPEMAKLYDTMLLAWGREGDGPFNAFVDVSVPTKWGSWGALRHLDDSNPRWERLMQANAGGGQRMRPEGTFLQGVSLTAKDEAGARLDGTVKADILLGGPGNDLIVGHGGADLLHGGEGTDTVLLPGQRDDYSFAPDGEGRISASSAAGRALLTSIERVAFSEAPESEPPVPLADLISG